MTIDFNQVPRIPAGASVGADRSGAAHPGAGLIESPAQRDLGGLPLYAVLRALNHLLKQQSWASDRLRVHAGRCVRIGIDSSFPLAALAPSLMSRIDDDGLLQQVSSGTADVSLWLKPSVQALFAGLRDGPKGLASHLRVDGDVLLAGVLGQLAQNLRWDVEEDLSQVVGDVAAHRAVNAAQSMRARARASQERFASNAVQYLTVEQPQLVDTLSFRQFRDQLAELELRIGALARRIA